LASNQQDIWFDQAAYPDTPIYNIGGCFIFSGYMDSTLLEKCIELLIAENDTFRLRFKQKENVIEQYIDQSISGKMDVLELHDLPEKQIIDKFHQIFKVPFSIASKEPLWQFVLAKQSENKYCLLIKLHHLIADGWTTKIIMSRVSELYNALLSGNKAEDIARNNLSYVDFIVKEQKYLNSDSYEKDHQYWLNKLQKLPEKLIDAIYPANKELISHSLAKTNEYRFKLPYKFYQQLNHFASKQQSSIYHIFILAIIIYFARAYQKKEITIGLPGLNRGSAKLKKIPGLFISVLPFSFELDNNKSLLENLKLCTRQFRQHYRHQHFPIAKINSRLDLLQAGRNSLFDIMLSFEQHNYHYSYGEASLYVHQYFSGVSRYPLGITVCEFHENDDVEIVLEGSEEYFSSSDVIALSDRFQNILNEILVHSNLAIKDMLLLSKSDLNVLDLFNKHQAAGTSNLDNDNDNDSDSKALDSLSLYYRQISLHPDKTAVYSTQEKLSWQQLELKSHNLALSLAAVKATTGKIVAICLPRSCDMIVSLLAVLKSGAAWLPIMPDYPIERILQLLELSQADYLISNQTILERLDSNLKHNNHLNKNHIFNLSAIDLGKQSKQENKFQRVRNSLCYVLFTSGSTGTPKGVMVNYDALNNRISWMRKAFDIQAQDNIGHNIAFNFDPALIEIFLSLTTGATLNLLPDYAIDAQSLSEFVIRQNIHFMALVPTSLRHLTDGLKKHSKTSYAKTLKSVCCGGEVLSPELAKDFNEVSDAKLFNVYGPTEAVIFASAWLCNQVEKFSVLPLGKPLSDTKIVILDQELKLLPPNCKGEIAIMGKGLAQGYLNQAELTEKSFVSVSELSKQPIYLTGDLGYIGYDGLLYFSGRKDRQIKLSGFRVEPGEIEPLITEHPQVNQCLIDIIQIENQNKLVAYVESPSLITSEDILELCQSKLPLFMQPWHVEVLSQFPLLSSGKVDLHHLKAKKLNVKQREFEPAQTEMEKMLLALWQKTLNIKSIGIHDNFFALGGDSLAAVTFMAQLDPLFHSKLSITLLVENPTIFQLSKTLEHASHSESHSMLNRLGGHNKDNPDFFLMASGHGDRLRFRRLADDMADNCNLHMLQPALIADEEEMIEDLATEYADLICSYTNKPSYIGGFSVAGITTLATARVLQQRGFAIKGIILLDTIYPRWPKMSGIYFKLLSFILKSLLINRFVVNGRRLDVMLADPGIISQLGALRKHQLTKQNYNSAIALFISSKIWPKGWLFSPWDKHFNHKLEKYTVHGMHGGIFQEENIHDLVDKLRTFMNMQ
ncbi:MAG: amino acid adenylation domain-containing protein, partial [Gammaproteobacteria bacterium]|nr:amino acid adenylation domain-containing protein [Gammaproteobacteria bacterium]